MDGGGIGLGGYDSPQGVGPFPILVLVIQDVEEEGCEDLVYGKYFIVGRRPENGSAL